MIVLFACLLAEFYVSCLKGNFSNNSHRKSLKELRGLKIKQMRADDLSWEGSCLKLVIVHRCEIYG